METRRFLVGGRPRTGTDSHVVRNPWDGSEAATVARPDPSDLQDALAAAARGAAAMREVPAWKRADALFRVAERLSELKERFARTIVREAGKPITLARAEVDRAVQTVKTSAEEALRIPGASLPLDVAPGGENRFAILQRFPVGPVACITPFNFPLNLVCHKVAPALAAGCSFLLKPASQTPSAALDLADLLLEAGIPEEAVSVLPLASRDAAPLVEDPRIRAVSFTGSAEVGWAIRRAAYRKKVVLELGGNAGMIVDASADLAAAASAAAAGGFGYAGQSCISVQRIFVHRSAHDAFLEQFLQQVGRIVSGDPMDERVIVGPMISPEEAARVESWIAAAVAGGARILAGGSRKGSMIRPTVLTGTTPAMDVCRREAFAPLVVVEPVDGVVEAIGAVDRSDYGLQAGIFTRDMASAIEAYRGIEVGAVVVNDAPTYRIDAMPYGGVKESGIGREGPRFAVEDFTEPRLLVLNPGRAG
jgi:acyl-CoA reductase-like NAD-dependent aldehyde dehydrogenase